MLTDPSDSELSRTVNAIHPQSSQTSANSKMNNKNIDYKQKYKELKGKLKSLIYVSKALNSGDWLDSLNSVKTVLVGIVESNFQGTLTPAAK